MPSPCWRRVVSGIVLDAHLTVRADHDPTRMCIAHVDRQPLGLTRSEARRNGKRVVIGSARTAHHPAEMHHSLGAFGDAWNASAEAASDPAVLQRQVLEAEVR